ncbi:MAG: fluoride exporter [Solirubrobacteraceae bacterium]|jgi:CrcB protein|nr:fluoride exporter [Solirubrobacteraceae bacterium]
MGGGAVSLPVWIGIGLLGGLGAVARAAVTEWANTRFVNVTGAFLAGLLAELLHGDLRTLVLVGLLGAYTTFSAWMLEARERGPSELAAPLALGLAAAALGRLIGGG